MQTNQKKLTLHRETLKSLQGNRSEMKALRTPGMRAVQGGTWSTIIIKSEEIGCTEFLTNDFCAHVWESITALTPEIKSEGCAEISKDPQCKLISKKRFYCL